jgi:hypothetical protein
MGSALHLEHWADILWITFACECLVRDHRFRQRVHASRVAAFTFPASKRVIH